MINRNDVEINNFLMKIKDGFSFLKNKQEFSKNTEEETNFKEKQKEIGRNIKNLFDKIGPSEGRTSEILKEILKDSSKEILAIKDKTKDFFEGILNETGMGAFVKESFVDGFIEGVKNLRTPAFETPVFEGEVEQPPEVPARDVKKDEPPKVPARDKKKEKTKTKTKEKDATPEEIENILYNDDYDTKGEKKEVKTKRNVSQKQKDFLGWMEREGSESFLNKARNVLENIKNTRINKDFFKTFLEAMEKNYKGQEESKKVLYKVIREKLSNPKQKEILANFNDSLKIKQKAEKEKEEAKNFVKNAKKQDETRENKREEKGYRNSF